MKNGDQPAYPKEGKTFQGLTKREYFAAMAMQGMLANPEITNHTSGFPSTREVIRYAEAILEQLETK